MPRPTSNQRASSPAHERLCLQVAQWIREEAPGATFYGPARSGKSSAIAGLAASIPQQLPGSVFTSLVNVPYELPDKPHALTEEWLAQEGAWSRGIAPSQLLPMLESHCIARARELRTNRVLLVVDDAHNLRPRHFQTLKDFGDGLKRQGCHVFTLLSGQPELLRVAEASHGGQALSIYARYFARRCEF